jgi:transposase
MDYAGREWPKTCPIKVTNTLMSRPDLATASPEVVRCQCPPSPLKSSFAWSPPGARLRDIYNKAASSIGCELTPGTVYEARTLLDELKDLHEMVQETDKKIVEVCIRLPGYSFLLSIPGFGPDISAKVLGALGNPHRFENERQVLRMAGLDLSKNQSGKSEGAPVISKKGKADLRYGLYQAALVASTANHSLMTYFTDKLQGREREKGIMTKMRVKLAAKMLVIAWTLMKKKEMFDPRRLT